MVFMNMVAHQKGLSLDGQPGPFTDSVIAVGLS